LHFFSFYLSLFHFPFSLAIVFLPTYIVFFSGLEERDPRVLFFASLEVFVSGLSAAVFTLRFDGWSGE